ncbi:hypothetical protein ABBQ38_005397 [Trebouxia sp. C0009 RCD-2024]
MPCLRSLGKSLQLYNLYVRSQAATIGPIQTAALLQQRASITDFVCEPATGTPAHPFQPISSASTTGDTFVPKGAKLSGHGAHPLARYRSFFPESVWKQIDCLFPRGSQPVAYDIAIGTGRGAIELAKRKFRVTAVESNAALLAKAHTQALECGVTINSISAANVHKKVAQHGGVASLVTIMHGIHLVDTDLALEECHRLLKSDGFLVLAWNDRNLSHPVAQQLESLVEQFNPEYNRKNKQRTKEVWGPKLMKDGLFNLVDYSVHANPLPMRNAKEAVELLEALPYIRVDMADHTKETFKKQLQDLLETHYQAGPFDFPLETKLFILRPIDSRESSDKRHSGHEGQVPFQFFPNRAT